MHALINVPSKRCRKNYYIIVASFRTLKTKIIAYCKEECKHLTSNLCNPNRKQPLIQAFGWAVSFYNDSMKPDQKHPVPMLLETVRT